MGTREKSLDVTRLARKYGIRVNDDIVPAITRTVAWCMEHYDEIKDKRKFA